MTYESIMPLEGPGNFKGLDVAFGDYHRKAHRIYDTAFRTLDGLVRQGGGAASDGHFDVNRAGGTLIELPLHSPSVAVLAVLGVRSPEQGGLAAITLKAALAAHGIEPDEVRLHDGLPGMLAFELYYSDAQVLRYGD